MVTRVGVRELRDHASQILKRVSQGEIVEVRNRGHVVARIVPAEVVSREDAIKAWLKRNEGLAQEISAHWQGPQDCVAAIREQRERYTDGQSSNGD
jgi:prevent-host-death family protein